MTKQSKNSKDIKILEFINTLKWVHPEIEKIFTQGGCFQFYKIMKSAFPEAIAYYDFDHVRVMIDKKLYDINGLCELTEEKEKFTKIMDEYEMIKAESWHKNAFWKNNKLS